MDAMTSNLSRGTSCHIPTQSPQHNPYARMPSRRAIACVTCAKAKTKCNKALPSCSRCITKGIKCQPRSTRRTSDNHGRSNVKKLPRLPRRHHATKVVSYLHSHVPSVSLPTSQEPGTAYITSYVDTESTAKSSGQDSRLLGYPLLAQIPPQGPPASNDYYAHAKSPECDLSIFTRPGEAEHYLHLGAISPQTPSPIALHEHVSVLNDSDHYLYHSSWPNEVHMSDEVGFETSVTGFPPEMWALPESATMVPTAQIPWSLYDLPDQLQYKVDGPASYLGGMTSSAHCQFRNDLVPIRPETTFYGPTVIDMSVVTSAPFMYDLNAATNCALFWEVPSMQ